MNEHDEPKNRQPLDAHQIHSNGVPTQSAARPTRPSHVAPADKFVEKPEVREVLETQDVAKLVAVEEPLTLTAQTSSSPGLIILQWLTYAFWGWTLLAVMWLVWLVVSSFFDKYDATSVLPYSIAAVLVLLPLSFVCDMFYSRKEPVKKSGGATVVMVIHAVIFALFGIGLLISTVFILVNLGLNGFAAFDTVKTSLISLAISVVLYAATFMRTLNPNPKLPVARFYRFAMLAFVGLTIILAFVGPAARSVATRDDRQIVASIDGVSQSVDDYTIKNQKLPASLSETNIKADAKPLIDRGLIRYKAEGKSTAVDLYSTSDRVADEYHYQLCVTYKEASSGYSDDYYSSDYSSEEYKSYVSSDSHPAGEVCYKLKVQDYSSTEGGISVNARKVQ